MLRVLSFFTTCCKVYEADRGNAKVYSTFERWVQWGQKKVVVRERDIGRFMTSRIWGESREGDEVVAGVGGQLGR